MRKLFLVPVALVAMSSQALAVGFNAGVHQTFGSQDYKGTNIYAALGLGGFSFSPEYRRYMVDGVSGPHQAYSGRLAYDMRYFGLGVSGGSTVKKHGYSARFAGADLSFTLSPLGDTGIRRIGGIGRSAAPVGKGVARVDFGAGALLTRHEQEVNVDAPAAAASDLTQTEYNGFIGASVLKVLVSGRWAKYRYSKTITDMPAYPASRWQPIAGHLSYAGDYPDNSFNLRVEAPVFPMVAPFASYTRTRYMELTPGSRPGATSATAVGLSVGLEMVEVSASYQHVATSGHSENFTGVGASLRL
ncbi:MAG TPA: hypothetical protein DD417_18605 [Elusimicrobia bacterium]|nr:hypothetical protein [Elusimicrobiota bacterium]